jgi:hypothetical protein
MTATLNSSHPIRRILYEQAADWEQMQLFCQNKQAIGEMNARMGGLEARRMARYNARFGYDARFMWLLPTTTTTTTTTTVTATKNVKPPRIVFKFSKRFQIFKNDRLKRFHFHCPLIRNKVLDTTLSLL